MDVGLALPQYDCSVPGERPLRWSTVESWADRAVGLGLDSLWLSDHLFLSLEKYGGDESRYGCIDPIVALGALRRRHPTTTVGCLVFCAQLRPPKLLAKQLETLDNLAPTGAVVAGLGAGWYEPEFAEAGIAFDRPGVRLQQLVDAAHDVRSFLDGNEREVPIWFGGKGDKLVDLAVRHADGWNTVWAWTFDDYRRKLDVVARTCDEIGRDPSTFTLTLGLSTLVGEDERDVQRRWERRVEVTPPGLVDRTTFDEWRRGRLVGTVEQVREQVEQWRQMGVRLLVANLGAVPFSVTDPGELDLVSSALK